MPNYKSSAFWVANPQELIDNFQFDNSDEDGLFMFVGEGTNQSLYIWRKQGIADNPKDIPANLGCWKFFVTTSKVSSYDISSWSTVKTLIYSGLSENRVDLKPYTEISWLENITQMIPIINANEVAESNYRFNVSNAELLTNFLYIYNIKINQVLTNTRNQNKNIDVDNSYVIWSYIKERFDEAIILNKTEAKRDYNYNTLCDYSYVGTLLKNTISENKRFNFIGDSSLLTDWGYICLLRS